MASFNTFPSNFQSDYQNYPRGYAESRPSAPLLQQYPSPDPRPYQQPYQQPSLYRSASPSNLKIEKTQSRLYKLSRIIKVVCLIAAIISFVSLLYWLDFLTNDEYDSNSPWIPFTILIAVFDFGLLIIAALGVRAAHLKTTKAIKNYLRVFIILSVVIIASSFLICSMDFEPSSSSAVENMKMTPDLTKADIKLGNFQNSILYRGHSLPRAIPNLEEWNVIIDKKWNKPTKINVDLLEASENENSVVDNENDKSDNAYDLKEKLSYVWTNAAINTIIYFFLAISGKKFLKAAKKYESLCSQNNFNFQQMVQPMPAYVLAQQPHMAVTGSRVH